MLPSFSNIVDKKRKIANSFLNASYESKLSKVVKSIKMLVMIKVRLSVKSVAFQEGNF